MAKQSSEEKPTPSRSEKSCKVEGCKRPYRAKGYCAVHYKKWRKGELPKPRRKEKTRKKED